MPTKPKKHIKTMPKADLDEMQLQMLVVAHKFISKKGYDELTNTGNYNQFKEIYKAMEIAELAEYVKKVYEKNKKILSPLLGTK